MTGNLEKYFWRVLADVEKSRAYGAKGDDGDPAWKAKVDKIEKTLATMKNIDNPVAVIGGLEGAGNLEEADKWLLSQLAAMGVPKPVTVFTKSDGFKGIIFARFANADAMNGAVAAFNAKDMKYKGGLVWCHPDRPINKRVAFQFCLALKKLFTSEGWGFKKRAVQVDDE